MKNRKQLLFFTNHLAILLQAGISLSDSLQMIYSTASTKEQVWLGKLLSSLRQGRNLSESLALSNPLFDKYYCGLIEIGEKSGQLALTLSSLSVSLENQANLQAKIQKALTYPVAVIAIAFMVLLGMLTWVIPTFENVFLQLNAQLPLATQLVLNIARYVSTHYIWILGFCILLVLIYLFLWHQSIWFQRLVDQAILKIPFFSHFLRLNYMAKWCSMVTTLQESGVPLLETIRLTANCSNQWSIHHICVNTYHHLAKGQSIHQSLALTDPKNSLFDKTSLQMIHVGESSGKLIEMLSFLGKQKEKELDLAVGKFMELLEPALITFLGLLIGAMVIALYLPLFKIGEIT